MSRTQTFIKETFNEYFDRLKEMAEHVATLRHLLKQVNDPTVKQSIQHTIEQLECDIQIYAKELKVGGMELSKRVA